MLWVLSLGVAALGLVMLIGGRPLIRWPRHRPPDPPGVVRASGLGMVLVAAAIVVGVGLDAWTFGLVLAVAAMLVGLIPLILASRQGRI
jgi:hypothetical protein